MVETVEYQRWLSSAFADQTVVETLTIQHPSFTTMYLARWNNDFPAKDEAGTDILYIAADFYIEPAPVQSNTNQEARGVISALQGRFYDVLRGLTAAQRAQPITVTHRLYFSDSALAPLIAPPPSWQVYSITADESTLTAELQSMALRDRAVGTYYTIQNFPLLYYV